MTASEITLSICKRKSLCVDCDDKKCRHAGDPVADCPVYPVGRAEECEQASSCDDCPWILEYIEKMRKEQNKC